MISQSPYKFQTDTGNIQSIDWSVIAFFIFNLNGRSFYIYNYKKARAILGARAARRAGS